MIFFSIDLLWNMFFWKDAEMHYASDVDTT
jgi:hypothetical protein